MFKKKLVYLFLIFSIIAVAQKTAIGFKNNVELLKQQDNFSEYIYIHLDEFDEKPSL